MALDNDKIDEAVLALLLLGMHDGTRAWKASTVLEPEVAAVFKSSEAVNALLRSVISAMPSERPSGLTQYERAPLIS